MGEFENNTEFEKRSGANKEGGVCVGLEHSCGEIRGPQQNPD